MEIWNTSLKIDPPITQIELKLNDTFINTYYYNYEKLRYDCEKRNR